MRPIDATTRLQVLDEDECLALLRGEEVGRLAVVTGTAPAIFPVNYTLDGDAIVFRTDEGTKLHYAGRGRAAFEIDGIDHDQRTGWSVVAVGRLEELTHYDASNLARAQQVAMQPWAGGPKAHWLRLVPDRITGRRLHQPPVR